MVLQSAIVQDVTQVEVFNSKQMESGDYSRKLVVGDKDGRVLFTLTLISPLANRLTIHTVEVTNKGGGKTV